MYKSIVQKLLLVAGLAAASASYAADIAKAVTPEVPSAGPPCSPRDGKQPSRETAMTITLHNPASLAPPFSCYSHGASVKPGARWLYVSGQVGVKHTGEVPEDPREQIELAWANLIAVLKDAGMTVDDLVKVDGFITQQDMVPAFRELRERNFAGHAAATTLIVVAGLAGPNLKVEIQAVAARVEDDPPGD